MPPARDPQPRFVRPGDANETAAAWAHAAERTDGPVARRLTRQKLPTLAGPDRLAREGVAAAAHLREAFISGKPQLILIATGLGAPAGFAAAETLEGEGIASRVVSLPCWERFDAQDQAYRDDVLPPSVRKRVSVEVGVSLGWERWVGDEARSSGSTTSAHQRTGRARSSRSSGSPRTA